MLSFLRPATRPNVTFCSSSILSRTTAAVSCLYTQVSDDAPDALQRGQIKSLRHAKRFPGRLTEAPAPDVTELREEAAGLRRPRCAAARPVKAMDTAAGEATAAVAAQRFRRRHDGDGQAAPARACGLRQAHRERGRSRVRANRLKRLNRFREAPARWRISPNRGLTRVTIKVGAAQGGRWRIFAPCPCGLRNGGHAEPQGPGGFAPYNLSDKSSENFWSNSLKARDQCIVWSSGK